VVLIIYIYKRKIYHIHFLPVYVKLFMIPMQFFKYSMCYCWLQLGFSDVRWYYISRRMRNVTRCANVTRHDCKYKHFLSAWLQACVMLHVIWVIVILPYENL